MPRVAAVLIVALLPALTAPAHAGHRLHRLLHRGCGNCPPSPTIWADGVPHAPPVAHPAEVLETHVSGQSSAAVPIIATVKQKGARD